MAHSKLILLFVFAPLLSAGEFRLRGLQAPVEILRDRWGIPHIYAQNQDDLYFAQGYMAAHDRLWQIDLWRRTGSGRLSEVFGPAYLERDRTARLLRFRGDWNAEWNSYAPDTYRIAKAFASGINAYIQQGGQITREFKELGYSPGLWQPEDVVSRVAAFSMMGNLFKEVAKAREVNSFGAAAVTRIRPTDPPAPLEIAAGLSLKDITVTSIADFDEATDPVMLGQQGSNNWVLAGHRTVTGKPLLASDPHRSLQIPSLRKTVHLNAPGINVMGAGEPALPGIALGHNEHIGFGFTITGTDQQDLYVEQLNPENLEEYLYKGNWKRMVVEEHQISVKGQTPETVKCRYTLHGPVVGLDRARRRAFVMRWVGTEPGTAGYLAGLSLSRAKNWEEFLQGAARFKAPAENLLYADTSGNIGFTVVGLTPMRRNWNGLLPVPGHTGEFEWTGFLDPAKLPRSFNPSEGALSTANANILPPNYRPILQYEWALPFRANRIKAQLASRKKWSLDDMRALQQDVISEPAKRFQAVLRNWTPASDGVARKIHAALLSWDAAVTADSMPAAVFAVWATKLGPALFQPSELGKLASIETILRKLESKPNVAALESTLAATISELTKSFGANTANWRWGNMHLLYLAHPSGIRAFDRGPLSLPGDGNTINAAGGLRFRATHGASFRMLLDTADWDRSMMTNSPGESGDPDSPHYSDLLKDWATGQYHPMVFSREAVEQNTIERIHLKP